MASKQKMATSLASYPRPVTLRQPQRLRYAELVGAIVPLALGLHTVGQDQGSARMLGLFLAFAAGVTIVLAVRDLRLPHVLTLDANGFRLSRGPEDTAFRWADVQHFREVGDGDAFAVGFDLVADDESGFRGDEYYFRFRAHYGLSGADFLALLTQWHSKSLGLRHP